MTSHRQRPCGFQPYSSNGETQSNPVLAGAGLQANWWQSCWPDPQPLSQTLALLPGDVGGWVLWQALALLISQLINAKKERRKDT